MSCSIIWDIRSSVSQNISDWNANYLGVDNSGRILVGFSTVGRGGFLESWLRMCKETPWRSGNWVAGLLLLDRQPFIMSRCGWKHLHIWWGVGEGFCKASSMVGPNPGTNDLCYFWWRRDNVLASFSQSTIQATSSPQCRVGDSWDDGTSSFGVTCSVKLWCWPSFQEEHQQLHRVMFWSPCVLLQNMKSPLVV